MVVVQKSKEDVDNMNLVLELKIDQHPELKKQLVETGNALIVEDVGNRAGGNHSFWGAKKVGNEWIGSNVLGKLWMAIREKIKNE